jgi:hypothetical protein
MRSCKGIISSSQAIRPELKTFGEVHRADRNVAAGGLNVFIENFERQSRFLCGSARARSNSASDRTNTPNSCGIRLVEEAQLIAMFREPLSYKIVLASSPTRRIFYYPDEE